MNKLKSYSIDSKTDFVTKVNEERYINLQFCHERELSRKNFIFLRFKMGFYAKLKQMHERSKAIRLHEQLMEFIDENLDQLYSESNFKAKYIQDTVS